MANSIASNCHSPTSPSEKVPAPRNEWNSWPIWQDVLKVERIGLNDNFFELGGDSIISIQVVSRARQAGIRFTPKDIFQHQTVQRLATVAQQSDAVQTQQGEVLGDAVLTPIQHYFFNSDIPARNHWNQSILLTPATALQAAPLAQALQHLQRHHDALRLRYRQSSDGSQSHALRSKPAWLRTFTLADEAHCRPCPDLQRSLDCSWPLIRRRWSICGRSSALLMVIHHLVSRCVVRICWKICKPRSTTEPDKPCVCAPRPARSRSGHASAGMPAALKLESEWLLRGQLRDVSVELPLDNPQGQLSNRFERSVDTRLDAERTRQLLQQAPAVYRTQVNDLLLTALARVLCQWTHTDSALVQLEGHGREDLFDDVDLSRTVGWFTSMFPVRLTPDVNLEASIKGIKATRAIPIKDG